jgi:DNA mismatch repair protein MSH3
MFLVDGLQKWSRNEMVLSAEALLNLEIFEGPGSLYKLVNRSVSAMGGRLMRQWLGHPLMSVSAIEARLEAVQATADLLKACGVQNFSRRESSGQKNNNANNSFIKLMMLLSSCGDLEQRISSIYHRRCEPIKFIDALKSFRLILRHLEELREAEDCPNKETSLISGLLKEAAEASKLKEYISVCLADLNEAAAEEKSVNWMELFRGRLDEPVPKGREVVLEGMKVATLSHAQEGIKEQEAVLRGMLKDFRQVLGLSKLEYKSVNGREYLLEIPRSNKTAVKKIPEDWEQDQHTKAMFRYLAPEVKQGLHKLNMYREAKLLLVRTKWTIFLEEFSSLYASFRGVVRTLATLDCITSFALLSGSSGYVRPSFVTTKKKTLSITNGRHPAAEGLVASGTFIGNDTSLGGEGDVEHMIITGPNMGGKSTYIRGVAQIVILAQCGCFVPADSCCLSLFDAVFVRMGAEDNLFAGKSTFFSELLSASSILETATEKSLVIMDELGRGTSTFDGTAIAYATLRYLAETVQCLSFFVTHYPIIGSLAITHPTVGNGHMAYLVTESDAPITFLYQVRPGLETRSYGLNVAKLAFSGALDNVLEVAASKSKEMEEAERKRREKEFKDLFAICNEAIKTNNLELLKTSHY